MYQYDQAEAAYYDLTSMGLKGDLDFYVEEAKKAGSPVLELGTGTGRISIPIAEAGVDIVGLDVSPDMLSVARQKVESLDEKVHGRIELVEGDMRDFSLKRKFNLVMIPYRAFLHVLTAEDQHRTLECVREHLADDGRFILNMFDPRLDIITAHIGSMASGYRKLSEFTNPATGRRVIFSESRNCDPEAQIINEDFIFEEVAGDGQVVSKTISSMKFRWIYRYEMQYLLENCGFAIEALYGDFQRGPFTYGGEQIWVTRKS